MQTRQRSNNVVQRPSNSVYPSNAFDFETMSPTLTASLSSPTSFSSLSSNQTVNWQRRHFQAVKADTNADNEKNTTKTIPIFPAHAQCNNQLQSSSLSSTLYNFINQEGSAANAETVCERIFTRLEHINNQIPNIQSMFKNLSKHYMENFDQYVKLNLQDDIGRKDIQDEIANYDKLLDGEKKKLNSYRNHIKQLKEEHKLLIELCGKKPQENEMFIPNSKLVDTFETLSKCNCLQELDQEPKKKTKTSPTKWSV